MSSQNNLDPDVQRLLDEMRLQVEEQRQRADKQQQRADEQQQRADEQQQRADEQQQQAEEERQLRLTAEQNSNLHEFLDACHKYLHRTMAVETDPRKTTKGEKTKPDKKIRPIKLRPWTDFVEKQQETWDQVYQAHMDAGFPRVFNRVTTLEDIGQDVAMHRIASEDDLRHLERFAVENRVQNIINHLKKLPGALDRYPLGDGLTFHNHDNTLSIKDREVAQRINDLENIPSTPNAPNIVINSADFRIDQVCVKTSTGGVDLTVFVVEYKPPHKLTLATVRRGLEALSSTTFEEVINCARVPSKDDKDGRFQYHSRHLLAAVVTQTFSYMIHSGIEYSYITTGETFIFLRVSEDDPTVVLYHLAEPTPEVDENPDAPLRNTAVSQVFAFTLLALQSNQRSQAWIDRAKQLLPRWEYDMVAALRDIPETIRKDCKGSEYKPRPTLWHRTRNSPYPTRHKKASSLKNCAEPTDLPSRSEDLDSDSEGENAPDTPTPQVHDKKYAQRDPAIKGTRNDRTRSRPEGQKREYCTQRCLLGMIRGGLLDQRCPNVMLHRGLDQDARRHQLGRKSFSRLVQEQLKVNRDDDCEPLGVQGSRGALFKITLTCHGYTVVGKGTIGVFVEDLQHEREVYMRLRPLQGVCVPLWLGNIDLSRPYYLPIDVTIVHMMLLSWGGPTIGRQQIEEMGEVEWNKEALRSIKAIHHAGVLHNDVRQPNWLWNAEVKRLMMVDFERSELMKLTSASTTSSPLALASGNKRKRDEKDKDEGGKSSQKEVKKEKDPRFLDEEWLATRCIHCWA